MRRAFCFLCGKKPSKLIEGSCKECYLKQTKLIDVPKKLEFVVCSKCEKIKIGNKWTDKFVEDAIRDKIKFISRNVEIKIEERGKKIFEVTAKAPVHGIEKKQIEKIIVHQNKISCPVCSRMLSGYYEAIIQLRGKDLEKYAKIIDDKITKSKDPKSFYGLKEVKNGFDFFIGSKSVASAVAESLKKEYNLPIKKSFKLVTKKDGKDIYRTIISVRIE